MLLDSNIIIYSFQQKFQFLQAFMSDHETSCSAISRVETLGYPCLSSDEKQYLEKCFETITVFPISQAVIDNAVNPAPATKNVAWRCHYRRDRPGIPSNAGHPQCEGF